MGRGDRSKSKDWIQGAERKGGGKWEEAGSFTAETQRKPGEIFRPA
jgi:hypothetical protein